MIRNILLLLILPFNIVKEYYVLRHAHLRKEWSLALRLFSPLSLGLDPVASRLYDTCDCTMVRGRLVVIPEADFLNSPKKSVFQYAQDTIL